MNIQSQIDTHTHKCNQQIYKCTNNSHLPIIVLTNISNRFDGSHVFVGLIWIDVVQRCGIWWVSIWCCKVDTNLYKITIWSCNELQFQHYGRFIKFISGLVTLYSWFCTEIRDEYLPNPTVRKINEHLVLFSLYSKIIMALSNVVMKT